MLFGIRLRGPAAVLLTLFVLVLGVMLLTGMLHFIGSLVLFLIKAAVLVAVVVLVFAGIARLLGR